MIHILYGADDYSLHEALLDIKKSCGDPEALATNTPRLEGSKLNTAELRAAVETFPFFGDKRLIIIRGLLERFEGKARSTGTKTANTENGSADFASILISAPPTSAIILLDGELKKTNPLLKELACKATIREFSALGGAQLEDWIRKRISKSGSSFSEEAINMLVRVVGHNLWVLASEIDKLCLFAGGRRVEPADVELAASASREAGIFELVDAVMEGRDAPAQRLLQTLLRDGQAPSYIIFMLTRQLRLLVRAKSMLADGVSESEIQSRLGLHDFALRKTLEQARRFGLPRLKTCYHELLEADLAIKTGRYDEDVAVSLLVAETCAK